VNKIFRSVKITLILVFTLLLISTSTLAVAQYDGGEVTQIEIDNSGSFTATTSSAGVTYEITGNPGSTGTVTTTVYNGNPQATAKIPEGIGLTKYVVVAFDFNSQDFEQATLTFTYTDADVAGLQGPFAIYKYIPETNEYIQLEGELDTTAKTITVTLNSTNDPLFAIGGSDTSALTEAAPTTLWIAVAVAVIVIVLVVFIIIKRQDSKGIDKKPSGYWRPGI